MINSINWHAVPFDVNLYEKYYVYTKHSYKATGYDRGEDYN